MASTASVARVCAALEAETLPPCLRRSTPHSPSCAQRSSSRHCLPALPNLGGVALDPGERRLHLPVADVDDARIAADEADERDRFRGGEGEIAAGAVHDLAVPGLPSEPRVRAVRHLALEDCAEDACVDLAVEPELGRTRTRARPGARRLVGSIKIRCARLTGERQGVRVPCLSPVSLAHRNLVLPCLFVFGRAAQTPFGLLPDSQKRETGAIALEKYRDGR